MGKTYPCIDDSLQAYLEKQPVYFVATAPSGADGHINLSPKGLNSFRVLGPHSVAYCDLVGSGIETVAHLNDNGRIVIMFCSFEGPPKIVRLHGTGEVVTPEHPDYPALSERFPPHPGIRCFIRVTCQRISDSCGFGVPLMAFEGERPQLIDWAKSKGDAGLKAYQQANNATSLDGLPGLP